VYGQQTIREGRQRLHERSAKDPFRHGATRWMDLVHQPSSRISSTSSGCPLVVIVEPTHDRKSDHFVPCILSGRNRSAPLRYLLLNPLMRPCLVEVGHIRIEHPLELLLLKNQQVVQAFLPHTSQEAFADRIGSWCMNGRCENLYRTRGRHPSKTGSKFVIVITNQVLGCLPIRGGFSELLRHPGIGRRPCHADVDHLP
jgi:hypothetical protein